MTLSKRNLVIAAIAGLLAIVLVFAFIQQVRADITSDTPTVTPNTFRYYRFFATSTAQTNFATSTIGTATSTNIAQWMDGNGRVDNGYFVVAGAKGISVIFGRSATTSSPTNVGTSTYSIQATAKVNPSESDWINFPKLVQSTTTVDTFQANGQIAQATSTIKFGLKLDYDTIYAIRCIAVITTDGQNTCEAVARF